MNKWLKVVCCGLVIIVGVILSVAQSGSRSMKSRFPQDGYIPNRNVAGKVAAVLAEEFFGASVTKKAQPFDISLKDGLWIVRSKKRKIDLENIQLGGTFEIRISKKTAAVVYLQGFK